MRDFNYSTLSLSVVCSWFMRKFSVVQFYMLNLMTFGFPWTHLYSCLLVQNEWETFSLAHSRSSVGGGTVITALFSNQHCSLWERCHIKNTRVLHWQLGNPCHWVVGGRGRPQAMRHSIHHLFPPIS